VTREIPLTQGLFATVDASDFEELSKHSWCASRDHSGLVYAVRGVRMGGRQTKILLHRQLLGLVKGDGLQVDHVSGNTLDNRRSNLRLATARENRRNITSSPNQKKGRYKGVYFHKRDGKWCAEIRAGEQQSDGSRRKIRLGLFTDPIEAALAYDTAARRYFGEFESCNFPLTVVPAVAAPAAAPVVTVLLTINWLPPTRQAI